MINRRCRLSTMRYRILNSNCMLKSIRPKLDKKICTKKKRTNAGYNGLMRSIYPTVGTGTVDARLEDSIFVLMKQVWYRRGPKQFAPLIKNNEFIFLHLVSILLKIIQDTSTTAFTSTWVTMYHFCLCIGNQNPRQFSV